VVGTTSLGGPFVLSAATFLIAAVVLAVLLRPDPLLMAQARAGVRAATGAEAPATATGTWAPLALVALTTLVAVNVAMIAIMSMTPLHLEDGGGTIEVVGLVLSLHLGAMFLPSPLTGWLSDRYGRLAIVGAGAVTMFAAGALAALSGPHAFVLIAVALVLLGLGWNLGLVSASALLIDATPEPDRPRAQGFADLSMSFAGGAASLGSGLVLEYAGFATLGLIGAGVGRDSYRLAPPGPLVAAAPGQDPSGGRGRIAAAFGLSGERWMRHANPVSVWTRFGVLPLIVLAIWSRDWIGLWCLVPIAASLVWMVVNPLAFPEPASTANWASRAVFGERVWTERDRAELPRQFQSAAPSVAIAVQLAGVAALAYGLVVLEPIVTLSGTLLCQTGKLWYLDRMVLLFEEVKGHDPEVAAWEYGRASSTSTSARGGRGA
jgi:MFS family permease